MTKRRLVLVERDEVMRAGIQALIEGEDHAITLMTYTDLEYLQQDLEKSLIAPFDILIIDDNIATPFKILDWLKKFNTRFPSRKIMLLSERLCSPYIHKILSIGVLAYIHKREISTCLTVFLKAIQTDKRKVLSPILSPMAAQIVQNMVNDRWRDLNSGDLELLRLLAQGLTTKQIAIKLDVNYQTVCRRRRKVREVLDVSNNEQIVDAARRHGLI